MHKRRIFVQFAGGFTLIELLVVIAIIALLIAILMPALSQARASSKLAVCASNLHQLGVAVHTYATENNGYIPRGPEPPEEPAFDFSSNRIATNQLWIGSEGEWGPPANPLQYNGVGMLLERICPNPKVYYCPGDENQNLQEELPRIHTAKDAYGSYVYRQLDQLPKENIRGMLEALGSNEVDEVSIPVEALALDTNSFGPGPLEHLSHGGEVGNVLYRDASVRRYKNRDDCIAIPAEAYADPFNILAALDQMLVNTDYSYRTGRPDEAPKIEQGATP